MDKFQITQTLATHTRFTVFEARREDLEFPMVLKQCEYREVHEAESFIRSALMKTKTKAYSQPLLFIFADVDEGKSLIVFVWKKGEALDTEVERDEESRFPSGKAGYGKSKVLYKNPLTKEAIKRAQCLTLGTEVVLKISKRANMVEMNYVFKEALTQARCAHPNVCDFLDFRLYQGKSDYSAYIVMESLKQNLAMEIQEGKSYDEIELITILQQVSAALLNAKSQNFAHQDIKPHNIFRGQQGLKLADFGATWLVVQSPKASTAIGIEMNSSTAIDPEMYFPKNSTAIGTEMYNSPEAWEAMWNQEVQQRPFESDIFSLGMTMLHLAETKLPERKLTKERNRFKSLLRKKVNGLKCSMGLKRLLMDMLSIESSGRPPLEDVQRDAQHIYEQTTQKLKKEALRLSQQAKSRIDKGENSEAIESAAAAHANYSRFPESIDTANNLRNWGSALRKMGRSAEAEEKYSKALAIFSRFPESKDIASCLKDCGDMFNEMGMKTEAMEKYTEANAALSRFPEDIDTARYLRNTAKFLKDWGDELSQMERSVEAAEKYSAALEIFSQLPRDIETAKFLKDWGNELSQMGRNAEAAEKYSAALEIFSRLPKVKDTASSLKDWGDELSQMGRNAEAAERYEAARAIYVSCHLCFDVLLCDAAIAKL